jgi:hypothetical protein
VTKAGIALIVAVTSAPAVGAEPFVGSWSTGSSMGLARCSSDDDGKMILTTRSETGYENHCLFTRKELISRNTWRLAMNCKGEGMVWRMNAIVTVEGSKLIYHTISHGKAGTNVYQRCPTRRN